MADPKAIKSILPKDEPINISRAQMTMLMMESFKKSSNSAEELMCLKEVAKLNGLYEREARTQINILNIEQNVKKLETMSDEDLLRLAGHSQELFKQLPYSDSGSEDSIDAEYSEITEGEK